MTETFTLPNFLVGRHFPPIQNPHHDPAVAANIDRQWMEGFKTFHPKVYDKYKGIQFSLLASLTYPNAQPAHLRGACDYFNWVFLVDDVLEKLDSASAREHTERLIDIFRDPVKPRDGLTVLENMTANFWYPCLKYADPVSAARFVDSTAVFLRGVCQEVEDRNSKHVRKLDEFLNLRRATAALRACYDFLLLPKHLPDEVITHPVVATLTSCAGDAAMLSNDIISLNFERSHGLDDHNMVSVVMTEKMLDVQAAVDFVAEWYNDVVKTFMDGKGDVPSFGEAIDPAVAEYISGLETWFMGYVEWCFMTERYFGVEAPKLRTGGVLELVPRKSKATSTGTA